MANVCGKCGKALRPGSNFCPGCGSPLNIQEPKSSIRPSSPKNTKANAPSKKKSDRSRSSFLNVFLTVTMVIQLIVAGFWHPGFLREKPGNGHIIPTASPVKPGGSHPGTPNPQGNPNDSDGLILGNDPDAFVMEVTKDNSPGNPFLIEVDITQKELDETPVLVSAEVSSENHEVTAGSFKADFKEWNLENENDTWNIKALAPKEDQATGYTLMTYDFSLASGQHEFPTCVEIHMPRSAGEYESSVVWYNMEAGCWEPVSYAVSEDGSEYIIRTDHFSPFSELVNWFRKYTRNSYEMAGTIYDTVDVDSNGNPYPQLQKPVRMVDERVHDLLAWPQESQKVLEMIKNEKIPDDVAATNFMNTFNRFGLGYGNTVGQPISAWDEKLINGLAGLKITNKLLGGAKIKAMKYTGTMKIQGGLLIIGAALTGIRIIYQICSGGDWKEVLKANAGDLTGLGIGAAGYYIGGSTGAALGWVGLVVFLGFEVYAQVEPTLNARPVDNIERIYRHYIILKGNELTNPAPGDTRTPDLTYGAERYRWAKALRTIFERNKDSMEKIPEEVNELYDSYVHSFWNLTEEERRAFAETAPKSYRTMVPDEKTGKMVWKEWQDPEDKEKYIKHTKESIVYGTQDLLLDLINAYEAQAECEIKAKIMNEVLPRLNTDMIFYVRDTGMLNADESFDKSPFVIYAKKDPWLMQELNHVDSEGLLEKKYPYSYTPDRYDLYEKDDRFLYFQDQVPYLFEPGNEKGREIYTPPAFCPHINEDSSEVFRCKYYYYMMIGNPEMMFINSEMEGTRDISPAAYSIDVEDKPDAGGNITAQIIIDRDVKGQFEPQIIKFISNDYRSDGTPVEMTFTLRSDGSFELTMPAVNLQSKKTEKDMGDLVEYQMKFYKDYKYESITLADKASYTLKGKLRKEELYDDRTGWTCYGIDNSEPLKFTEFYGSRESYTTGIYDRETDQYSSVDVYRVDDKTEEYTIKLGVDEKPEPDSISYYSSTSLTIRTVEENGTKKLQMKAVLKGFGSGTVTTEHESNLEKKTVKTEPIEGASYDHTFSGEAKLPARGILWLHE